MTKNHLFDHFVCLNFISLPRRCGSLKVTLNVGLTLASIIKLVSFPFPQDIIVWSPWNIILDNCRLERMKPPSFILNWSIDIELSDCLKVINLFGTTNIYIFFIFIKFLIALNLSAFRMISSVWRNTALTSTLTALCTTTSPVCWRASAPWT